MRKTGTIVKVEGDIGISRFPEGNLKGFRLNVFLEELQEEFDRFGIVIEKPRYVRNETARKSLWVTNIVSLTPDGDECAFSVRHTNSRESFVNGYKDMVHGFDVDRYAGIMGDMYASVGQRYSPRDCMLKAEGFKTALEDSLDSLLAFEKVHKRDYFRKLAFQEKAYGAFVKYSRSDGNARVLDRKAFAEHIYPDRKVMKRILSKSLFEEYAKFELGKNKKPRMFDEVNRGYDSDFANVSQKVRNIFDANRFVLHSNRRVKGKGQPYEAVVDCNTAYGERYTFVLPNRNNTSSIINSFCEKARDFDVDEHVVDRCMTQKGSVDMELMYASSVEIKERFENAVRNLVRYQKKMREISEKKTESRKKNRLER